MSTVELVVTLLLTFLGISSTQDADHFTIKFEDKILKLINMTDYEQPLYACKDSLSPYYHNYGNFLSADLRTSICEKAYEIDDQKFNINFYPKVKRSYFFKKGINLSLFSVLKNKLLLNGIHVQLFALTSNEEATLMILESVTTWPTLKTKCFF